MAVDPSLSGLFFGFDRLDRVVASFEQTLGRAAVNNATDAGIVAAAGVQRYQDGTLGPVDLTPGMTDTQVAYNRSARNAYVTRQRLDAEARAGEFMRKNQLDPEGFRSDWQSYMDGVLGKVGDDPTAAALSLDLTALGNKSYAGLANQKLDYDRQEQKATFTQRADQLSLQARSLAARSGRWDSEEIRSIQDELDGILGVMVKDRHIFPSAAKEVQIEFGKQVFLQAARTRVEAAYNAGKTPMGPGNYADAMKVAKELAWQAAETLGVDPEEAMKRMMGLAVIAQQNKQAILAERREEMQIANERRAAVAHARAEQSWREGQNYQNLQLEMVLRRSNGDFRPLLPADPGDDRVGGGEGQDQIEVGDRPAPLFKNVDELVKRVGKGRAAQMIEEERRFQAEAARNRAAEIARQEQLLMDHIKLGQPVRDENGRVGLELPGGVRIFDPENLPGTALARARFADGFFERLKSTADQARSRDEAALVENIGKRRALAIQTADEIVAGKQDKEVMASIVEDVRKIANDVTLPEAHRSKWAGLLTEVEKQSARVDKEFKDRSTLQETVSLRGPMDDEQRTKWTTISGLELFKPDPTPQAAMERTARFLDDLAYRNMQIAPKEARYLATALTSGAPRGMESRMVLEKALAVLDHVEGMPAQDQALFDKEMGKYVSNWAEIKALAPAARVLYETSSKQVTTGGVTEAVPTISWTQAYKEVRQNWSEQQAMGTNAPPTYTADEASAYISKNAATVAPGVLANAGTVEWLGWMTMGTRLTVPPSMANEFARTVQQMRLTQRGSLPGEAERIAAAKIMADGWFPSAYATSPTDVRPWGTVQPVFKRKPIEWHMDRQGFGFGNQALLTFAAGTLARERGLSADDAWKFVSNGLLRPIQVGDTSQVQFVVIAPPGGKLPNMTIRSQDALAAFYPGGMRTTFLQDRDGRPYTIDIADPSFRDFNRSLEEQTFRRARDLDLVIPPTFKGGPLDGQRPSARLPLGDLVRDFVADPTARVGGTGARRAFDILYESMTGNSSPNMTGTGAAR